MSYAMVLITESDITNNLYWKIVDSLSEQLPVGICEDNVIKLNPDAVEAIIHHIDSPEGDEDDDIAGILGVELSDQFVVALLLEGDEKALNDAIIKTSIKVYGERATMNLLDDGYWEYLGGALTHTTDQEQVWRWASQLFPKESHYYPHEYR